MEPTSFQVLYSLFTSLENEYLREVSSRCSCPVFKLMTPSPQLLMTALEPICKSVSHFKCCPKLSLLRIFCHHTWLELLTCAIYNIFFFYSFYAFIVLYWSEVCMILAFLPHSIFLYLVICFAFQIAWTPDNSNAFDFPWRSSYRESTVT